MRFWMLLFFFISGCATTSSQQSSPIGQAQISLALANSALLDGDPKLALQHLQKAHQTAPHLAEIHHSFALAYHALKSFDKAEKSAKTALTLAKDSPEIQNTYGKILMDIGKYESAKPLLLQAAQNELYRDTYKPWTSLGIIAFQNQAVDQAIDYLDKAIFNDPKQACVAYYYLGNCYMKKNNFDKAIMYYKNASKNLCTKYSDARLALGLAYHKNGQYDLARSTLLEMQKLHPHTQGAHQAMQYLKDIP